jgi:hypothetical protein
MLTKADVKRIEQTTETVFEHGGIVGKHVAKYSKTVIRFIIVVGVIAFLGVLAFIVGMFSNKKEIEICNLNDK